MSVAPAPTGKPTERAALAGMIFPWDSQTATPVLLAMEGTDTRYLPCFGSAAECDAVLGKAGVTGYNHYKRIDDAREFLLSLPTKVRGHKLQVIVGLHCVGDGKWKFLQIHGPS